MFPKEQIPQGSKNDFQEAEIKTGINLFDVYMDSTVNRHSDANDTTEVYETPIQLSWHLL